MLLVNSFNPAFVRLTTPTLPVSSHVARNVVSSILITIGWDLETRFDRKKKKTYSLTLPWCFHTSRDILSKIKASPVFLSGLKIWTFIVVGPGWSVSSRLHSRTMSNKIENRYQWTELTITHLRCNSIGCCGHKWMEQSWERDMTYASALVDIGCCESCIAIQSGFRGIQVIYCCLGTAPRIVMKFRTAFRHSQLQPHYIDLIHR